MKTIEKLKSDLEKVRKTPPNYDGDELEILTTYLKFASELFNEINELPYFKKRITDKKILANIILEVDRLFYKCTEATMNINN